ncbi:MAG TPA: hypothetical protein PLG88_00190 [Chitinophagaceae bacterium]|nr:hypothetical protein [Chitinophagaceae bacterium]
MTQNDGGPAFPTVAGQTVYSHGMTMYNHGMTLRDWFAGQAVRARWGNGEAMTPEDAADMAYQLADAILKARKK